MHSFSNQSDLTQIVERLQGVQATDAARWGVMNAAEMMCHLRGAFRMAMGELPLAQADLRIPPPVLKFLALSVPLRWPKHFGTIPALKLRTPAMQLSAFPADQAAALEELHRFIHPEQRRVAHPFMGAMSFADWMRWGYLHTDHHLRQFGR